MGKLKPVFYSIYILFFLFAAFMCIFYEKMVLEWQWDWIDTWIGLMMFVLKLCGLGVVLFIVNLIIERLHIQKLKKQIDEQKNKIVDLENKLSKL